jgi:hypothetical protein
LESRRRMWYCLQLTLFYGKIALTALGRQSTPDYIWMHRSYFKGISANIELQVYIVTCWWSYCLLFFSSFHRECRSYFVTVAIELKTIRWLPPFDVASIAWYYVVQQYNERPLNIQYVGIFNRFLSYYLQVYGSAFYISSLINNWNPFYTSILLFWQNSLKIINSVDFMLILHGLAPKPWQLPQITLKTIWLVPLF